MIQRARILTFGYDGHVAGREQLGSESIQDLANNLLSTIAIERRRSIVSISKFDQNFQLMIYHDKQRPIIFVMHGFGGIILKAVRDVCVHNSVLSDSMLGVTSCTLCWR